MGGLHLKVDRPI